MSVRAGGRWGCWGLLALAYLVAGCTTVAAVPPRPCDTLDDRPGLRAELRDLRALPGDPFKRTRWYALDADQACAGDRVLGAAPITPPKEPGFWARLWARIKAGVGL